MSRSSFLLLLGIGLSACGGAHHPDPPDGCVPTAAGVCTPNACATGNAQNVGAYCTKGGGQCDHYSNFNLACAIDLSAGGANFCIQLGCTTNAECGAGACCTGDPSQGPVKACVPLECLVDAGLPCPTP